MTRDSRLATRDSVLAAVLGGVLAALVATAWHEVVTEPLVDQAIQLEEARHGGEAEAPVVSRRTQRFGLGLALVLYGASWGLALGGVFALAQRWLPGGSPGRRAVALALAASWGLALLPFLKYPANPPGVGDPETIGMRQALYFALLGLGSLGAPAALAVGNGLSARVRPGWIAGAAWPIAIAGYLVYCGVIYVALPPNPDPTPIPIELLNGFRLRSGLGLLIFWAVFAAAFGYLARRWSEPQASALAEGGGLRPTR